MNLQDNVSSLLDDGHRQRHLPEFASFYLEMGRRDCDDENVSPDAFIGDDYDECLLLRVYQTKQLERDDYEQ